MDRSARRVLVGCAAENKPADDSCEFIGR